MIYTLRAPMALFTRSVLFVAQGADCSGKAELAQRAEWSEDGNIVVKHCKKFTYVDSLKGPVPRFVSSADISQEIDNIFEGPSFTIDKDSVHRMLHVSDDGLTLTSVFPTTIRRGPKQLTKFRGGRGTIGFSPSGVQQGRVHFQVRVKYDIKRKLEKMDLVFEVGLARLQDIDKAYQVSLRSITYVFCVSCCKKHSRICGRLRMPGKEVSHTRLSSNSSGTSFDTTFCFRLDLKANTFTVIDCEKRIALGDIENVNFEKVLWPVFGVYLVPTDGNISLSLIKRDEAVKRQSE